MSALAFNEAEAMRLTGVTPARTGHWALGTGNDSSAASSTRRCPRLDRATLLRRTFDVDVKHCARCGGRMTVRAVVTDAAAIARLLAALRSARDPPAAA